MIINKILAGIYAANCYICRDEKSNDGFIIDPGGDVDDIMEIVNKNGINVKGILLTHGHVDHAGGVYDLKKIINVPVYINEKDKDMIINKEKIFELDDEEIEIIKKSVNIKDGSIIRVGNMEIKCMETPGHTPGGMSFIIDNNIFTGDTIFFENFGRDDLPGGNINLLIDSIINKIFKFEDDTVIYPGHGQETTVGHEKLKNHIKFYIS